MLVQLCFVMVVLGVSFETPTTGFQMQGKDKHLGDYITILVLS